MWLAYISHLELGYITYISHLISEKHCAIKTLVMELQHSLKTDFVFPANNRNR